MRKIMAARASRASAQRQILKYALLRARARSANNATWKLWGLARQLPAIRMMHSIGWLASHPRDDESEGCFCGCAARAPQRASRVDEEVCRLVHGPPGEAKTRGDELLVRARCARQRATELLSAGGRFAAPRGEAKRDVGVVRAGAYAPAERAGRPKRTAGRTPAPRALGRTKTSATFCCAPHESAEQGDEGAGVVRWACCAQRQGGVLTTVLRTVPKGGGATRKKY